MLSYIIVGLVALLFLCIILLIALAGKKKGVLNDNISKKINASSSNRTVKEAIQKTDEERKAEIAKAQEYLKKTEKKKSSGGSSLADKANMVKRFNEQNNK